MAGGEMAGNGMAGGEETAQKEQFVYRVSTQKEWYELQRTGATLGGDIDRSTGCIHLSSLHQVKWVLGNFFHGRLDLFLLQVDASKIGEGLVYETVETKSFPHFYGPDHSFIPLSLDCVSKAEKLEVIDGEFTCSMLTGE
ncbi:hypothetical protein KSP40_PGU003113 [Platanthera guangdongensis]|uniref:DUF952 domain-containing protein n=1 Tax=Platanthera guangdongensis TaxID=2320717 RepID=A0ABR2N1G0_9ASPA